MVSIDKARGEETPLFGALKQSSAMAEAGTTRMGEVSNGIGDVIIIGLGTPADVDAAGG